MGVFNLSFVGSKSTPNMGSRDVLLIFPGKFGSLGPQIPLSLLYLAGSLRQAGFDVRIFDMRVENLNNYELGDPLFTGITTMSGAQIKYGLEFAKKVRKEKQSCPIVWGGVHPTLLPEQTITNAYVDIVVRGEGELAVVALANALNLEHSLENVAGITYKINEEIRSNPLGPQIEMDSIPIDLPYELLSLDKYPSLKAGRFFIQTSRGCPCRCGFCYNLSSGGNKWRGKSANRVLDEIEYLIKKFPDIRILDPIDDNFFVSKKRVEDICKGIINRKINIKWRANCRFDYLASYDKDFISLLEKAGCVELDFGGESGSTKIQTLVKKDITHSQIIKSVENLRQWAPTIEPYVSWISGLPQETYEDLEKTFNLMDEMKKINPKTQHYAIFVYTPFPSPLLNDLPTDFQLPTSLEEWGNIEVFHFDPTWHPKKYVKKLRVISAVSRFAFYPSNRLAEKGVMFRIGYKIMNRIARFRWRHRLFLFPLELMIVDAMAKKIRGFL